MKHPAPGPATSNGQDRTPPRGKHAPPCYNRAMSTRNRPSKTDRLVQDLSDRQLERLRRAVEEEEKRLPAREYEKS